MLCPRPQPPRPKRSRPHRSRFAGFDSSRHIIHRGLRAIMDHMAISADILRNHLEYSAWASQRLLDMAAGLSKEELTRDFQTADHSVLGTLVHVYAADRIWLARVTNAPPGAFLTEADYSLSVLVNDWPA